MKLWFLLAMMPGASDTLQRDIQRRDRVIACSLPDVQPLPQHHSIPRDQDPIACRAGTPMRETCRAEDTWVALPQSWLCLQQLDEICRASSVLLTPCRVMLVKMPFQLYRGSLREPVLVQG